MDSKLRKQSSDEEQNTSSKEKKRKRKIDNMPVETLLEGSQEETDDSRKPEKNKRSKKKKKDKEEGVTVHQEAQEDDGDIDGRTQADNDSETNIEENTKKMKTSSDSYEETQTMEIISDTVIDSNLTEGKGKKKKKKKKAPDSAEQEQVFEEENVLEQSELDRQTDEVVHEVVIQSSVVAESSEDPKKKKKKKKKKYSSSPLEEIQIAIPSGTETSEIVNEITIQSSVAEENVNEDQRKKKKKKKKQSFGEEQIVEESSSVIEEMTAEQPQMKIQTENVIVETIKDNDVLEEDVDESQGKKKKKNKKKKYVSDVDGEQTVELSEVNLETGNVVFETTIDSNIPEEEEDEGKEKKKKKKHSNLGEKQIEEQSDVEMQMGNIVNETVIDDSIAEKNICEDQRKKKKKKKRKMSESGEEEQILEHVEAPKQTDEISIETVNDSSISEENSSEDQGKKKKKKKKRKVSDSGEEEQILEHMEAPKQTDEITIETVIDSSIPEEDSYKDQGKKKKKKKKRKTSDSREEELVLELTEVQKQMAEIIVETVIDSNIPEETLIENQEGKKKKKKKKVVNDQQNTENIIESEVPEQFEILPNEVIVPEESDQAVNNEEHESVTDVLESLKAVIESAFFKPADGNDDDNPAEEVNEESKTEEEENRHPFDLLENPEIMSKLELDRPKEVTIGQDCEENVTEQDSAVASIEQGGTEIINESDAAANSEMAEAVNQIEPEPTFTEATIKAVDASGKLITIPVRLENVKTYIIRTDPNAARNIVRPMVKPSELHSWVLTEEDKKNLKSKGLQIEYGRWSKRECDILKRNVESFCVVAKVDSEGFRKMIFDDSSLAKKTRTDIGFYSKLADGISRPLREVYRKLRQLYDPDNYKGKFSASEKHTLIALQKKYGNEWSRIGEEMGRSGASVMRKFRRLCLMPVRGAKSAGVVKATGGQGGVAGGEKEAASGQNEAAVDENEAEGKTGESNSEAKGVLSHGRWSKEETDRLKISVLKLCGDEKSNEIDERVLHWDAISHMVGTRNSEQCRRKWQLQLKWKDPSEKKKKWTQEDNARFIVELSRCGKEDARLVEWEKISEAMEKFASPEFMKKKWYGFKIMVPDYHSLDFKEVLDWLLKNYVHQLRARFPAWKL